MRPFSESRRPFSSRIRRPSWRKEARMSLSQIKACRSFRLPTPTKFVHVWVSKPQVVLKDVAMSSAIGSFIHYVRQKIIFGIIKTPCGHNFICFLPPTYLNGHFLSTKGGKKHQIFLTTYPHSALVRNLIKMKGTANLTAEGERVSLKDSKNILFETLAHQTWKGRTNSCKPIW